MHVYELPDDLLTGEPDPKVYAKFLDDLIQICQNWLHAEDNVLLLALLSVETASCCWRFCLTRGWLRAPVRIVRLWASPSCESPTLTENLLQTASCCWSF
jgi:hypothetical protein